MRFAENKNALLERATRAGEVVAPQSPVRSEEDIEAIVSTVQQSRKWLYDGLPR